MTEQKAAQEWDGKWNFIVVVSLAIIGGAINFYLNVSDKMNGIKQWLKK